MRGCVTWWFGTPTRPSPLAMLHLHPGAGPVVNTAVISNAAPSYAPAGSHLVSAVTLDEAPESQVRRQLATIYGVPTTGWQVVAHQVVAHSLPAVAGPVAAGLPSRVAPGLHVAGDHRAHASIQGAMVSGRRSAAEILAALRA